LEAQQHTLFRHLKTEFFNRNLAQNMPKNAYFLEKKGCKITAALRAPPPEPPFASGGWGTPPPDSRVVTPN